MAAAAVLAGVSAVASIAGGIFGASSASKSNAAARKAHKKQKKEAKKVAKLTNKHNDKLDAAEQANYKADKQFEYETRVINHEFDSQIVDIKNAAANAQFEKSEQISAVNLGLNEQGSEQAIDTQIASIKDKFVEQQFAQETALSSLKSTYFNQSINRQKENISLQGIRSKQNIGSLQFQNTIQELMTKTALTKESNLVEGLLAQGKGSLGQAGGSAIKTRQSIKAGLQRSLQGLSIELAGKNKQAALELANLNAETSLAETGVGLNLQVIDDAISSAEEEAVYNQRVSKANMDSFLNQSKRNLDDIGLKKSIADINVLTSKMIKPIDIPYAPTPRETPDRIFVDRMKVRPSFIPPPAQQSVVAPLLGGVASAAGALSGLGGGGGGGGGNPINPFGGNYSSIF
jgi:hypothetical protein